MIALDSPAASHADDDEFMMFQTYVKCLRGRVAVPTRLTTQSYRNHLRSLNPTSNTVLQKVNENEQNLSS